MKDVLQWLLTTILVGFLISALAVFFWKDRTKKQIALYWFAVALIAATLLLTIFELQK